MNDDLSGMTFKGLQDRLRPWAERNFGVDRPPHHPLLGAVEEVGELAHAYLKAEQGIRTEEDHEANAKDSVADAIIYLADYCNVRSWDLQEVMEQTLRQVLKRDWKNNPATAHKTDG